MTSKNIKHTLVAATVSLVLAGCGSTAPKISEADILSAERNGTLQSLYNDISSGTGKGQKLKDADRSALLKRVGSRLAKQLSQSISALLNQNRLAGNQVPLGVLEQQQSQAGQMQKWDGNIFQTTINSITNEMEITKKAIEVKQAVYDALDMRDIAKKNNVIEQLKTLYGTSGGDKVSQMLKQLLSDNFDLVDQMVANKQFDEAIGQLKQIVAVSPNFRDAKSKLIEIEKTATQDTFIGYVRQGETDKAHQLLKVMAKGQYFDQQKTAVMPSAIELANYYVAMGVEATSEENLVDAYNMFTKARGVKGLFGLQSEEVTQESDFIDFVYTLYEEAYNKKSYGLALGYLSVISHLRPNFPELETYTRLSTDNVMDQAVKRISTTPFNGGKDNETLGRSIASKITQFVFDTLPQDIKVVERDQLDAVMREQEINALKQGSGVQLDSADLLIQGTILEADVETERNKSSKTMRVVTERRQVNNPAYSQWLNLSNSKREKTPQPEKTITKETKEDVTIGVTYVRKVAVLSISYRIIDSKSGSMIYADSVTEKTKLTDQSTEGVELGEFKSPFKMADLPSNSEMLGELTSVLSKRIGDKVVELLRDPEQGYQSTGEKHYDERSYVQATEEVAKALVMSQSKNKQTAELTSQLRQYAMAARIEE